MGFGEGEGLAFHFAFGQGVGDVGGCPRGGLVGAVVAEAHDGDGGEEDDAGRAEPEGEAEDLEGAFDVGAEEEVEGAPVGGEGCGVDDGGAAGEGEVGQVVVVEAAVEEGEGYALEEGEVRGGADQSEDTEAVAEEVVGDAAADEAVGTRDEDGGAVDGHRVRTP